jgi:hypothetical protein
MSPKAHLVLMRKNKLAFEKGMGNVTCFLTVCVFILFLKIAHIFSLKIMHRCKHRIKMTFINK